MLNHKLLTALIDKVNRMGNNRNSSWRTDDMYEDDDIIWSKWIDDDLPEDVGTAEDPDYFIEEDTISSNARRYNLRRRYNL